MKFFYPHTPKPGMSRGNRRARLGLLCPSDLTLMGERRHVGFVPSPDLSRCSNIRCRNLDYSMTSSARASSREGTSMPIAFAVTRFTTRSNFVACSTGMSPGFAPRRILLT